MPIGTVIANRTLLSGRIGPNSTHPNAVSVEADFTESAINPGTGTSTVTCVVRLVNNNDAYERHYSYLDAFLNIHVNGVTSRLGHYKVLFDLKGGATTTLATLVFNSVPNGSGSVAISMDGSWPQWYAGHNSVSASGSLAMTSSVPYVAPAPIPTPPTAPLWPSNGNSVGPTGIGTSTYLNWISRENLTRGGTPIVAPYDTMTLLVSQASYPSHFNPVLLDADVTIIGGGYVTYTRSYAVQTFWFTPQGKTQPSTVIFRSTVGPHQLLRIQPPSNAPVGALGWGVLASMSKVGPADPTKVSIQTTTPLNVQEAWIEPVQGITTNGGSLPAVTAGDLAWSQNTAFPLSRNAANGQAWPQSMVYPTIGGFWYQFHLVVGHGDAGYASQAPITYFAPGTAPNLGANGSNSAGEGNVAYAPMANIAIFAQAYNDLNASASVQPVVAQVIDFAARDASLTETTPLTQINYCGDPRAYWVTISTGGNTTASPYVAEQNSAGYTSRNAQVPPTQMLYALGALGLGEIDRGDTMAFVAANNNTGSAVSHYVYIGGNPDSPNLAAAQPVPAGANSVALSTLAWINSANAAPGRAVTPFAGIRFTALYANGATAGSNTVALAPMGVNALKQLTASWALPANSNAVVAALIANTAAGAAWNGGYQAGDTITTTGFMLRYANTNTITENVPYFDGGFPDIATYAIHCSADLGLMNLSTIPNTRDGHAAGFP